MLNAEEQQIKDLLRMALPHDFGQTITFLDRRARVLQNASGQSGVLREFESIIKFSRRPEKMIVLLDDIDSKFNLFWDTNYEEFDHFKIDRVFDTLIAPRLDDVVELAVEFSRLLERLMDQWPSRAKRRRVEAVINQCNAACEDIEYFGRRSKHYVKGMIELLEFTPVQNPEHTNLNTFFSQQRRFILDSERKSSLVIVNRLPTLSIDYSHCYSLFSNLIKNSLKYRHGEICRMFVVAEGHSRGEDFGFRPPIPDFVPLGRVPDGMFAVHFVDLGIGIDPKKLKSIFKPFKRGLRPEQEASIRPKKTSSSSSSRDEFSGMGIGLAVVKRVVDLYNGNVYASSTEDKGTCITVNLPLVILQGRA